MNISALRSAPQRALIRTIVSCVGWLLIAASVVMIVMAFRFGVDRGDDGQVNLRGRGHLMTAICGLLSIEKYRTGRYVCASAAEKSMRAAGLSYDDADLQRAGKTAQQWAADTSSLDNALRTVFAEPPQSWDGNLSSNGWGADAGYMDFVQFSFSVFGKRVEAIYDGYFLLLLISAILFSIQFYRQLIPLAIMATFFFVLLFFTHDFLTSLELQSSSSPRLLSLLAIIPLFHSAFLLLETEQPSIRAVSLLIPQALLMAAAGDFRGLAYWAEIAMVALCVLALLYGRWCQHVRWLAALGRCWPGGVVILCFGVALMLAAQTADPRIAATGGMRLHTIWEPLYYDLQYHPDWNAEYGAQHNFATGDDVARVAVDAYRQQHGITGSMTEQEYERYIRIVYLQFLKNDPIFVIQLKYFDLLKLFRVQIGITNWLWSHVSVIQIFFVCAILNLILFAVYGVRRTFGRVNVYAVTMLLFFLASAGPIWATVVNADLVGDTGIMTMLASLTTAFWITTAAGALAAAGIAAANRLRVQGRHASLRQSDA